MQTRALEVILPSDVVERVEARVASGEYASESAVVEEGLRVLEAHAAVDEAWLRTQVVASFDEYKADPSIGISAADVSAGLDARLVAFLAKSRQG